MVCNLAGLEGVTRRSLSSSLSKTSCRPPLVLVIYVGKLALDTMRGGGIISVLRFGTIQTQFLKRLHRRTSSPDDLFLLNQPKMNLVVSLPPLPHGSRVDPKSAKSSKESRLFLADGLNFLSCVR